MKRSNVFGTCVWKSERGEGERSEGGEKREGEKGREGDV